MKLLDLNPAKVKILFELSANEDIGGLPWVSKISERELYFEEKVDAIRLGAIKKVIILVLSCGKWQEYVAHPAERPARESLNLMPFMIDDAFKAAFKQDILLVCR